MKQELVGTSIGRFLRRVQARKGTLSVLFRRPENILEYVNSELARDYLFRMAPYLKTFVDVGAHIGSVAGEVMLANRSAALILIEPIDWKAAKLRQKFPNAEVKCCAIGANAGEAEFYIDREWTGNSSLRPANGHHVEVIRVPVATLDAIAAGRRIDFVKIDVEGAELGVFEGGHDVLSRSRPVMLFESAPPSRDETPDVKEAVWRCLDSRGYEILVPNRVLNHGPGMSLEVFVESHEYPRRTLDYFAIPRERREEVRTWLHR